MPDLDPLSDTVGAQLVRSCKAHVDINGVLTASGEEFRFYGPGSLGQGEDEDGNPSDPTFPYVVWNELPSTAHLQVDKDSNSQWRYFTVHVYDHLGAVKVVNQLHRLIRDVVKGLDPFNTTDEGRCIEARWLGLSGFVPDREKEANVRFCTIRFKTSE